ncbi:ABC transporter permease subunit [Rossellomorea aquimaris]|uniref:ABC transporter permease subunit n=1 Tax=Rossellomorea aquimaris TaxID=189382 RepID=UPI0007D09685|nr:ABC transporter permease subunit [Rossellomorea aquimaris]
MLKLMIKTMSELSLILLGILLVSATSALFVNQSFSFSSYSLALLEIGRELLSPTDIVYINPISGIERSLFPIFLLAYWSSARIFFLALCISLLTAIILLILYYSSGKTIKKGLKGLSFSIGALPDIFVIILFQLAIVWFFKQTGTLLIDFASVGQNQVVILPAITLSILPSFFFFSNLVEFIREEEGKPYVELAKSKGLGKYKILFFHTIRNVFISLTYHGKQISWMMLSNLLILEYLFNVFGVTSFLFSYNTPVIFAITSISLFVPLYLLLKCLQFVIRKVIGKEMSL